MIVAVLVSAQDTDRVFKPNVPLEKDILGFKN